MDWNLKLYNENEKPLDNLVSGYSHTSVFRRIAFIGDSLSSGEFETCDRDGNKAYHDLYEYSWGQYIARKNGLTAFNFSRGGMTAKEYIESFAESNDFFNKDKACQCYVIALGANDLNQDIEVGSVNDINKDDYTKNNKNVIVHNDRGDTVRLNKYISESGFCSRREADKLIESGRVTVDGKRAVPGQQVSDALLCDEALPCPPPGCR